MQNAGAIFLPAGGMRNGTKVDDNVCFYGNYWGRDLLPNDKSQAYYMTFGRDKAPVKGSYVLDAGFNVRLVRDAN